MHRTRSWNWGSLAWMLLSLWAVQASAAFAQPTPRGPVRVDLNEAVARTLAHDQGMKAAEADVREASFRRKSVRGRFLPVLDVGAGVLRWNAPRDYQVIDPENVDLSQVSEPLQNALGSLLEQLGQPLRIYDQTTSQVRVSIAQPLTSLYQVHQGHQIGKLATQVASDTLVGTRQQAVFATIDAYYTLAKAMMLEEVAESAVTTIAAHVEEARQFKEHGLIEKSDVLAAEVELASARADRIRAREAVVLSRALLAKRMGLAVSAVVEIYPLPDHVPGAFDVSLEEAQDIAVNQRPELNALTSAVEMADRHARIERWDVVPKVAGVGSYLHFEGVPMLPKNAWFVGIVANLKVLTWGTQVYEAKAAAERTTQVEARLADSRTRASWCASK